MLQSLIYLAIPLLGILIGTIFSQYLLSKSLQVAILHFVSGILLGIISIDFIPIILTHRAPFKVLSGFVIGSIFMLFMQTFEKQSSKRKLTLASMDFLVDGITIGLAFFAGKSTGILVASSLFFCALLLTLSTAEKKKRGKSFLLFSTFLVLGALFSTILGQALVETNLSELLSFTIAALLYLSIEELMKEAHKEKDSPYRAFPLFAGFFLIMAYRIF